jgi:hypothetical protein
VSEHALPPSSSSLGRTTPAIPNIDPFAVVALILGLLWFGGVGSALAVLFGTMAVKRIDASGGWRTGKGIATAGIVLGAVGVVTLAYLIIATVLT